MAGCGREADLGRRYLAWMREPPMPVKYKSKQSTPGAVTLAGISSTLASSAFISARLLSQNESKSAGRGLRPVYVRSSANGLSMSGMVRGIYRVAACFSIQNKSRCRNEHQDPSHDLGDGKDAEVMHRVIAPEKLYAEPECTIG